MIYDRIVSIFLLLPVVIFVIFFASEMSFLLFILMICIVSSWEWGKLMKFSPIIYCIWMCIMLSLLVSVIIFNQNFVCFNNYYIVSIACSLVLGWWFLAFLLVLFYPNSAIFWNKYNILRFCFGILMIVPFLCSVLVLYRFDYFNLNWSYNKWWLFFILMLIWINDSSAYFIGKKFGKYKLLKNVSPKKTWEGCIGGVFISTCVAWALISYIISDIDPYIIFISCLGAIIFSVIGDLTESMFKREAGVKDISNLIPGHGGLLDRIDSVVSAVPIFTVLMLLIHINNLF